MRIERIETVVVKVNARGNWIFVLIHTDEELVGLGEASHSRNDPLVIKKLHQMEDQLKGRDPDPIGLLFNELNHPRHGRVEQTALSAVEQALWDIKGRRLGAPIHRLLGGSLRSRLLLYANINRHVVDRSPAGFARAAETAVAQGFRAVKIAPFDELNQWDRVMTGKNALWRNGVDRVRAVRAAIGPEIELAVDCHNRLDPSEALIAADALAELDLFWFEEPVNERYPEKLAQISGKVPMPTASGENLFSVEGYRQLILERAVDVLMPDVKQVGGIAELIKVAAAARLNQMLISPHNPAGPVSTAACAQASATLDNFYRLEYAWGEVDWRAELLDPPERIEDGYLILPEGRGLGHRLNRNTVSRHRMK